MVPHGSITVDGVSLTVNELPAPGRRAAVAHRVHAAHTTLGELRVGDSACTSRAT